MERSAGGCTRSAGLVSDPRFDPGALVTRQVVRNTGAGVDIGEISAWVIDIQTTDIPQLRGLGPSSWCVAAADLAEAKICGAYDGLNR